LKSEGKQFAKEIIKTTKECVKGVGGENCTQEANNLREHVNDVKETLKAGAEMLKEKAMKTQ